MAEKDENELCDSWEELEDSGELDKHLEKISLNRPALSNGTSSRKPEPLILSPEDVSLKCLPPEPSVKILQRPNGANGLRNGLLNGESKPKQPLKSLQQREAEYAEARLRILGEAQSPQETGGSCHQLLLSTGGGLEDLRLAKIQTKTEILRPLENCAGILRLPKGPDGTSGFNFKR